MSSYVYEPLPDGDWIRLVTILPQKTPNDDEIDIILTSHRLSSTQSYETLSYTWGDTGMLESIRCEKGTLKITNNLYICLRHLREECSRRYLWIDAISINQYDEREKELSIPLMPSIYIKATRTICWIGSPLQPSVSRLVGRLISCSTHLLQSKRIITDPDPYHVDSKITVRNLELFQADPLLQDQQAWQDLQDFVSLPYFGRYVPQDIRFAVNVSIIQLSANISVSATGLG